MQIYMHVLKNMCLNTKKEVKNHMLLKSIKMNLAVALEKKSIYIMYFFVIILVLVGFFLKLNTFEGKDINDLVNPMNLMFLSDETSGEINILFFQYYPLLLVIPAAFAYVNDRDSGEMIYIKSRVGTKNYYIGKYCTCFIVTFICFSVPFYIDMLLNLIAFPTQATANGYMDVVTSLEYEDKTAKYLFSSLWKYNRYLYSAIYIAGVGVASALLATFAMAVSTFKFMKYKILIFVPVYVLLFLISRIGSMLNLSYSTNYYYYLSMFSDAKKNGFFLLGVVVFIISFVVVTCYVNIKKGELE